MEEREVVFPNYFVWGAAASAPQSEGGLEHSDWIFRERKGLAPPSGEGNGRRQHYAEDFARLAELGLTHFRTSVEWSRIEPQKGLYQREAVEEYRRMIESAARRGITIWLSLHHITLPAWFARLGGFFDETALQYWHRFVEFMARELGREVEHWIPINDPVVYAGGAYLLGIYPPGHERMDKFLDMLAKIHRAHGDAFRILKALLPSRAKVGIAAAIMPVQPLRPEVNADQMAADFIDSLVHQVTLDALKHGVVKVPGKGAVEIPSCRGAADFFGIDYFFRLIASTEKQLSSPPVFRSLEKIEGMPTLAAALPGEPLSELCTGACPAGLYEAIKRVLRAELNLPLYITANGFPTTAENLRLQYIHDCLSELQRALSQGLDVRGYFYWSDVDQYEWNRGFDLHYGLLSFDPETKHRTLRPAATLLSQAARERKIPPLHPNGGSL